MKLWKTPLAVVLCLMLVLGSFTVAHGEKSQYAGTEIELMHFWVDADDLLKDIAKEFEQETGIHVLVTLSPVSTHLSDLNARVQMGSVPEIFTMWPGSSVPPYVDSNVLADLTDLDAEWIGRMSQTAYAASSYYGSLYLAPVNYSFMGIAYNKSMFEAEGWELPNNMDEFEELLEAAKNVDGVTVPWVMGNDCLVNVVYLMALSSIYQQYPDFDDMVTAGEISLDCPEMVELYTKLYIDWVEEGYYNYDTCSSTDRMSKAVIEFLDGKAAFFRVGSWDLNIINELNQDNIEIGLMPIPGADNDGSALAATGEAFALSAFAEGDKRGAAIEFLNYLMNAENNGRLCGAVNSLSPYDGVEISGNPIVDSFQQYVDETARGWIMWSPAVQAKMGEAYDIILAEEDEKAAVLQSHLELLESVWMGN